MSSQTTRKQFYVNPDILPDIPADILSVKWLDGLTTVPEAQQTSDIANTDEYKTLMKLLIITPNSSKYNIDIVESLTVEQCINLLNAIPTMSSYPIVSTCCTDSRRTIEQSFCRFTDNMDPARKSYLARIIDSINTIHSSSGGNYPRSNFYRNLRYYLTALIQVNTTDHTFYKKVISAINTLHEFFINNPTIDSE